MPLLCLSLLLLAVALAVVGWCACVVGAEGDG